MDDVPIRGVIPDDCRVRREDLGVGKVRAHVGVCGIFVELFYLFNGKFTGISRSKIKEELGGYRVDARSKLGNKERRIRFGGFGGERR